MSASTEVRQAMFSLIERWKDSGLNQKRFCELHRIATHSFYYWYKRYRSQSELPCVPVPNSFVEVSPAAIADTAVAIELFSSGGHRILFHQPVSASFIKALIN